MKQSYSCLFTYDVICLSIIFIYFFFITFILFQNSLSNFLLWHTRTGQADCKGPATSKRRDEREARQAEQAQQVQRWPN